MRDEKAYNTGMRAWGEKMSSSMLEDIKPLIGRYHPDTPEIINAYFGDNYYTLYLKEDEGIYQETYRYFGDEFTRIFRGPISLKDYDAKQLLNLIPAIVSLAVGSYVAQYNVLGLVGGLFLCGFFFYRAIKKT